MRMISCAALAAGFALAGVGASDGDAKKEAIEKDRRVLMGVWRVTSLELGGKKLPETEAREFTIVNGLDGTWTLRKDTLDVMQGTSEIDPTQKIKTIDFTPADGSEKDKVFLGIYEITKDTRKVCFAQPGQDRPTDFSTEAGDGSILITCTREKTQ